MEIKELRRPSPAQLFYFQLYKRLTFLGGFSWPKKTWVKPEVGIKIASTNRSTGALVTMRYTR